MDQLAHNVALHPGRHPYVQELAGVIALGSAFVADRYEYFFLRHHLVTFPSGLCTYLSVPPHWVQYTTESANGTKLWTSCADVQGKGARLSRKCCLRSSGVLLTLLPFLLCSHTKGRSDDCLQHDVCISSIVPRNSGTQPFPYSAIRIFPFPACAGVCPP